MMVTIKEIRRTNARYLAQRFRNQREFADAASITRSQLSQLIGPNPAENIGSAIAKRMEKAAGRPEGWLDREHPKLSGKQEVPPERYIDSSKLVEAVQEIWEAMELRGEKINPTLLSSAVLIYLRLKDARGEANPIDADQSIAIASSTIRSLNSTR
ncbi:hypothetical protein [Microbulbifer epialgicus]|uniref:HTH cro/C1-type domain-containing protein n=1 Tax=Microbulbifer epialgicus TaxID=393907 RepID=A0ABV4P712_9GAMM